MTLNPNAHAVSSMLLQVNGYKHYVAFFCFLCTVNIIPLWNDIDRAF